MSETKYYEPDIEELHYGFQYERWSPLDNQWRKETYVCGYNIYGKYRVKHLDHDDIVSLEWEIKNKTGSVTRYIIGNGHELTTNDKGSSIRINGVIYDLLNKSELKRLMRQLNIKK